LSYDNTCKYLAEQDPRAFVRWIFNIDSDEVELLKTELLSEPVQADSIIFLRVGNSIKHLEFQTLPYSYPPIPTRMLDYKARLVRQYNCEVKQAVIFLKATTSELVFQNRYKDSDTIHRYQVIRLWEEDPAILMADPGLLPLATLARSDNSNSLLAQVAQEFGKIESTARRNESSACISILAGLRFEKQLINQLFKEEVMRESVIYQDILQKGRQIGRAEGRVEGREEGLAEGRAESYLEVIYRLSVRRFGVWTEWFDDRLKKLSISELEDLVEALLDFSTVDDLAAWLQQHESGDMPVAP